MCPSPDVGYTADGAIGDSDESLPETAAAPRRNSRQAEQSSRPVKEKGPRLRSACDGCHAAKIRCTGENPCARCVRENISCHYSYMSKLGKPKGSLNKKTIERLQRIMNARPPERNQEQDIQVSAEPKSAPTTSTVPVASDMGLNTSAEGLRAAGSEITHNATTDNDTQSGRIHISPTARPEDTTRFQDHQEIDDTLCLQDFMSEILASTGNLSPRQGQSDIDAWLPMVAPDSRQETSAQYSEAGRQRQGAVMPNCGLAGQDNEMGVHSWRRPSTGSGTLPRDYSDTRSHAFPVNMPFPTPLPSLRSPKPQPDTAKPLDRHCDMGYNDYDSLLSPSFFGTRSPVADSLSTSPAPPSRCNCFSSLSTCLCELQDATQGGNRPPRSLDVLLRRLECTIPIIASLFACQECMRETQGLLLANMVLSRLLRWLQASMSEHARGHTAAHVRLGSYIASKELGCVVTRLLLRTHCMELRRTVDEFHRRAHEIEQDKTDRAYLIAQAKHFRIELQRLDDGVHRMNCNSA